MFLALTGMLVAILAMHTAILAYMHTTTCQATGSKGLKYSKLVWPPTTPAQRLCLSSKRTLLVRLWLTTVAANSWC